ncbi:hypothetical protein VC188_03550 [Polynucleobacter sp. MG-28-Ekke-A2]|uniref:hypothetical protein n=1 Tax=Polynucleobacter sp. MG-28-Ekke-A2 TaxID=3108276 RepID=UPI002B22AF6A|nr:hypothetical protein [Polynucleobacter sp. MG-28-Ekke-A2]MEA9601197.1 hypothetical protein [Polynucleobacter sp. MG-28-Ekke-A2]
MRFRNQIALTMLIQGVGALAMLAATLMIGLSLGPAQQGKFSLVRAELQFIGALCLFGLPQAIFYFSESNRLERKKVYLLVGGVAIITLIVAFFYSLLTYGEEISYAMIFALAVSISNIYGVLRGAVLAHSSTRYFNLVSAAPQIIVLFFIITIIPYINEFQDWQIAFIFLSSAAISAVFTFIVVNRRVNFPVFGMSVEVNEIVKYGAGAWLTAVLLGTSSFFWLKYIENSLGITAVGIFTMGLIAINFILTPLNLGLPLLFKRWTNNISNKDSLKSTLISGVAVFIAVATILLLTNFMPKLPFLVAYSSLEQFKWIFGMTAVAEVMLRLSGVAGNAMGLPVIHTLAEATRALSLAVFFLWVDQITLLLIIKGWMFGAIMAVAASIFCMLFIRSKKSLI